MGSGMLSLHYGAAKHTFHNGNLFIAAGLPTPAIVYCNLVSLLAACRKAHSDAVSGAATGLWKQLDKAPPDIASSIIISFGGSLITIASCESRVFAHSPVSKSWVCVGELTSPLCSMNITLVAPTGELLVMGNKDPHSSGVWKAELKCS